MEIVMIILGALLSVALIIGPVISELFRVVLIGTGLTFLFFAFLLFLFGLFSPLFIRLLVNNPKDEPILPNKMHFFTFIEPGQVKIIVRGKRFIRAIMNDSERKFLKEGSPENADYWWVVPANQGEATGPIPPFNSWSPLSWWIYWVYKTHGAVFVGIWPFQGVRVDKNQRIRQKKENGKVILDKRGLPLLEDVEDWTDHLRVKGFFWYFKVPSTDTKDYLKIGFQGNLLVKCVNPYLATYNQDRWDNSISNKTNTLLDAFCKSKTLAQLSTSDDENRYEMAEFLKRDLNKSLFPPDDKVVGNEKKGIGMDIIEADITDRDPQLDEKERSSQTEPWRAEQAKKAAITASEGTRQKIINESEGAKQKHINESEGEAQAIINRIIAFKTGGEIGELLARYDAWVNTAKSGGATYFFGDNRGGSKELDPIIFAKLEEIRKELNEKKKDGSVIETESTPKKEKNQKRGGNT